MTTLKKIVVGAVAAVIVIVLAHLLTLSWLFSVIIGIIIGVAVSAYLIAQSRGEKPAEVAEEIITQAIQPDPGAEERPVYEQLVRLNERLRLDGDLGTVLPITEKLIDLLLKVVPRALEAAPGAETTFDLRRLATDHLPNLLSEFLDLSAESRESKQEELVSQLNDLVAHVTKLEEMLEEGQIQQFEVEHGFTAAKFAAA